MIDKIASHSDALVTTFSFVLMIGWFNVFTVIPGVLSTLYLIKKIHHQQVKPFYKGSWWKWIKSYFKK